ncbi:MAG: TRAP transporter large permease subunit [Paracoccus sp. (in: a-proteobacteria)]
MLIPPSVVLIVYGLAAQVSITRLFMALIGPGLLLATLYICYILFRARLNPAARRSMTSLKPRCLSSRGCPV